MQLLGKVGVVKSVLPNGDINMVLKSRQWVMNPLCLAPAPGATPDGGVEASDTGTNAVHFYQMGEETVQLSPSNLTIACIPQVKNVHVEHC